MYISIIIGIYIYISSLKYLRHKLGMTCPMCDEKFFLINTPGSTFRLRRSAQMAFRKSMVPVTPVYFVFPWGVGSVRKARRRKRKQHQKIQKKKHQEKSGEGREREVKGKGREGEGRGGEGRG